MSIKISLKEHRKNVCVDSSSSRFPGNRLSFHQKWGERDEKALISSLTFLCHFFWFQIALYVLWISCTLWFCQRAHKRCCMKISKRKSEKSLTIKTVRCSSSSSCVLAQCYSKPLKDILFLVVFKYAFSMPLWWLKFQCLKCCCLARCLF